MGSPSNFSPPLLPQPSLGVKSPRMLFTAQILLSPQILKTKSRRFTPRLYLHHWYSLRYEQFKIEVPAHAERPKNGPYTPFYLFFFTILEEFCHFFYFWLWNKKHWSFFFQLDFSWFQCTRYPGVPKLTTPRGKSPLKFFFWSKFLFHQILWTKTRRLTPRLSI